jgi:Zn-dependent peptidase ImmA (M78 family)
LAKAREMGQLLEFLVSFIPFDRIFEPPTLKSPSSEYAFIQKAAQSIRQELMVESHEALEFDRLIRKINDFEVILIPVFHGNKENHENALHIYLPSSKTTWIYLNLDTYLHDFKFWMAHELGHVLSPSLREDAAEDFADAFAQALLFPADLAGNTYASLRKIRDKSNRLKKIIHIAESLTISPITVYKAVNSYADENDLQPVDLDPLLFAATTNLCKTCRKMTDHLKLKGVASVREYIDITNRVFHSPFFDILKKYLANHEKSAGFIQSILDCSLLDAKEIHAELVD